MVKAEGKILKEERRDLRTEDQCCTYCVKGIGLGNTGAQRALTALIVQCRPVYNGDEHIVSVNDVPFASELATPYQIVSIVSVPPKKKEAHLTYINLGSTK